MVRLSVPVSVRRRPPPSDLHQPTALRREVHIVSLICTLASMVLLAVSLGLRGWATGNGKVCEYTYGLLSIKEETKSSKIDKEYGLTHYYNVAQQIIVSCILSISSLTIITSFVAMIISAGFPRERLEFLRHYSVFNIVSLLCIVLIGGLWVWVTETLPKGKTKPCDGDSDVVVKFGYAYYMAMGSGLLVLLAASLNLLRARTLAERRRLHQRRLYTNTTAEGSYYNRLSETAATETSETETDFSDCDQLSPPPPYAP